MRRSEITCSAPQMSTLNVRSNQLTTRRTGRGFAHVRFAFWMRAEMSNAEFLIDDQRSCAGLISFDATECSC
jgi:hypothetical protein